MPLHQRHQFCPRHHRVHLSQKLLTPRLLRVPLELCLMGQRHLPHAVIISLNPKLPVIAVLEEYFQRFPSSLDSANFSVRSGALAGQAEVG